MYQKMFKNLQEVIKLEIEIDILYNQIWYAKQSGLIVSTQNGVILMEEYIKYLQSQLDLKEAWLKGLDEFFLKIKEEYLIRLLVFIETIPFCNYKSEMLEYLDEIIESHTPQLKS